MKKLCHCIHQLVLGKEPQKYQDQFLYRVISFFTSGLKFPKVFLLHQHLLNEYCFSINSVLGIDLFWDLDNIF